MGRDPLIMCAITDRLAAAGFTPDHIAETRLDLRVIERERWRGRDVPIVEIEAVLVAWARARRKPELPFYIAAHPRRQLVLL